MMKDFNRFLKPFEDTCKKNLKNMVGVKRLFTSQLNNHQSLNQYGLGHNHNHIQVVMNPNSF